MKSYYNILLLIFASLFAQEQTFKLQDGTIIVGSILDETETTYTVETKYGSVSLNKNELIQTPYEITLNSGETFSGIKLSETNTSIQLKTRVGVLNIDKSDISNMKESGQVTKLGEKNTNSRTSNRRAYSLADMLFGTGTKGSSKKNIKFAMGEERLTDSFFDPTAYVLENGTLYLSGLSFAFGLSNKLHLSSRWVDFFWGNFNIRPKYMLFHKGNWEKESALAVGAHLHTYWQPDKLVWKSGNINVTQYDDWNGNSQTITNYNYGGYFPIGSNPSGATLCDYCEGQGKIKANETEELDFMFEFFTAYTFSKARKGMRGRISNTAGALIQIPFPLSKNYEWPYRIFLSTDVDITPKLKMVGEAFYDPFIIDLNHRTNDDNCDGLDCIFGSNYTYKVSETGTSETKEITKDDFYSVRPIHFDFGFIYAVNENFRFGIHTQPYIFTFYWKF